MGERFYFPFSLNGHPMDIEYPLESIAVFPVKPVDYPKPTEVYFREVVFPLPSFNLYKLNSVKVFEDSIASLIVVERCRLID